MSGTTVPGLRRGRAKSPFGSLLSMQMKLAYGGKGMAEKLGLGRKARYAYLYLLIMGVAFIPLASLIYNMARQIAAQSVAIGQPGLPVVLAVTAGQSLVFFLGISSVMSVLYYSDDTETLLGLPLTAKQIMLAKLMVAYVAEALISLVVTGPFLVALGLRAAAPEYWPYAVLIEAMIPAIPMALSVLATVLIMRVTKGSRKRDQFRVVFGLVFFVIILAVQYLNTSMVSKGPEETMRMLIERNGLIQAVAGYYPPLKWAAWALTADSVAARFGGLVLFCGVSFGVLAAVTAAAQRWFLGGLSKDVATSGASRKASGDGFGGASSEASGSRGDHGRAVWGRKGRQGAGQIILRRRRPASAVALRDHLMLVRTPNFLLVTLTNLLVFPLILVFGVVGGQANIPFLTGGVSGQVSDVMALILVGVHAFIVAGNQVSSTAITREGRSFWASKMIPVSPKEQVRGKVWYGLAVATVQLIVLLATAGLAMKVDAMHLAVVAILGALASVPVTAICIMNDLYTPKLNWEDPHQAMKGNFGTLIAMIFSALFLAAVGLVVKLLLSTGMSIAAIYGVTAALLVGAGIVLWRAVEAIAEVRYKQIEV